MSEAECLMRDLVALLDAVVAGTARMNDETRDLLDNVENWLAAQTTRVPFSVIDGGKR
jgi:hypothetical protein